MQCHLPVSRHLHRCQVERGHSECKPVVADRRIFAGACKSKGGRRKPIGNSFLDRVSIVTREQDNPIGGAVRPSNLFSRVVGELAFGVSVSKRWPPVSPAFDGSSESISTSTVLRSFSRPASEESLIVTSDLATPPPKLAMFPLELSRYIAANKPGSIAV